MLHLKCYSSSITRKNKHREVSKGRNPSLYKEKHHTSAVLLSSFWNSNNGQEKLNRNREAANIEDLVIMNDNNKLLNHPVEECVRYDTIPDLALSVPRA